MISARVGAANNGWLDVGNALIVDFQPIVHIYPQRPQRPFCLRSNSSRHSARVLASRNGFQSAMPPMVRSRPYGLPMPYRRA